MASPNNTIVASSGGVIVDLAGNRWAMAGGKVTINGVADQNTARVVRLAYENGSVWQMNADRLWWKATAPFGTWQPPNGTPVSPLTSVASPDNTVIATGGPGAIIDTNADRWAITAGGQVSVNGVADPATGHVTVLAFENGKIWQQNAAGLWWSKANAAGQWSPPMGTSASPVPTGPLVVRPFDLPPLAPDGFRQTLQTAKINDLGDIVGFANKLTPAGKSAGQISFTYHNGLVSETLPAGFVAEGINDAGKIAGTGGVLDSQGKVTSVPGPHGEPTSLHGINNVGQLVGTYVSGGQQHAFIASNGRFTDLKPPGSLNNTTPEAVNDLGKIVGTFSDSIGEHGFLYANGQYTRIDVPNALFVQPTGISDGGEIVGTYLQAVGTGAVAHGFTDIGGTVRTYDVPGSTQTSITGINNRGQVVGWFEDSAGRHGFVGDPTRAA